MIPIIYTPHTVIDLLFKEILIIWIHLLNYKKNEWINVHNYRTELFYLQINDE